MPNYEHMTNQWTVLPMSREGVFPVTNSKYKDWKKSLNKRMSQMSPLKSVVVAMPPPLVIRVVSLN